MHRISQNKKKNQDHAHIKEKIKPQKQRKKAKTRLNHLQIKKRHQEVDVHSWVDLTRKKIQASLILTQHSMKLSFPSLITTCQQTK
jgi:hypothetical protein